MLATASPASMQFTWLDGYSYPMDAQLPSESFSMIPTTPIQPAAPHALLVPHLPPDPLSRHQHSHAHSHPPHASSHTTYSTPSERWKALTQRDSSATDAFIYAVRTTRIYCRPDCRARLARRANVSFYDTGAQAERDGFRACKRCKPGTGDRPRRASQAQNTTTTTGRGSDGGSLGEDMTIGEGPGFPPSLPTTSSMSSSSSPKSAAPSIPTPASSIQPPPGNHMATDRDADAEHEPDADAEGDADDARTKIARAVLLVRRSAAAGQPLSLAKLAREVSLSKWHLQRVFKRLQGVTPREMAERIIEVERRGQGQSQTQNAVVTGNSNEGEAMAAASTTTSDHAPLSHTIAGSGWSEAPSTGALDLPFNFPNTTLAPTTMTMMPSSLPFSTVPNPFTPTTGTDMDFDMSFTNADYSVSATDFSLDVDLDVDGGGVEDLLNDLFPELYGSSGSGGGVAGKQDQGQGQGSSGLVTVVGSVSP